MKKLKKIICILLALIVGTTVYAQEQFSETKIFDKSWAYSIEEIDEAEFLSAYKNSEAFNYSLVELSDRTQRRWIIAEWRPMYEQQGFPSCDDWAEYAPTVLKIPAEGYENINILEFPIPHSNEAFFVFGEDYSQICDSIAIDFLDPAFSSNGILSTTRGFDCDGCANIWFYSISDNQKRCLLFYYGNDWIIDNYYCPDTKITIPMFWGDTNTLYVPGRKRFTTPKDVFYKIILKKSSD